MSTKPNAILTLLVVMVVICLYLIASHDIEKRFPHRPQKTKWLMLIFLLPVLGSVYYLIFGKKRHRTRKPSD
jgi:hypothetical protein